MRVRSVYYSASFGELFRKLPREIQDDAVEAEKRFRDNPFHHSLRTHKLKGRLEGYWSISITRKHRIIFSPLDNGDILFVSVGTHSIYGLL